jgi:hypothetical protein
VTALKVLSSNVSRVTDLHDRDFRKSLQAKVFFLALSSLGIHDYVRHFVISAVGTSLNNEKGCTRHEGMQGDWRYASTRS